MNIVNRMKEILQIQKKAITALSINNHYEDAVDRIYNAQKEGFIVITTGMGKAGIIAQKMSATMASIGIPSFYLNPAESLHGDLGKVRENDLLIIFSHSGATSEVKEMIASLHKFHQQTNPTILVSGTSTPQFDVDVLISYGQIQESCLVSKVPSTSTTLMLIIADILAITAAEKLGFNDEWFKVRHPGGIIGKTYAKKDE
ncbi:SIS domain-containing protein [Candidatus Lokiarchaeum ossiferum]|uniref:SIS domain-containing protein n=1 Tax=Candidatus Lokiarchaeum ossiferum TaxID=2951803 RepID=UPI00352C9373